MSDGNIIKTLYVDGKWPALEYVDGILYGYTASSYVGDGLRILDPITSVAQLVTPVDYHIVLAALAYNIETNTMYGSPTDDGAAEGVLVTIDLTTGQMLTATGIHHIDGELYVDMVSLVFDNDGVLYGGDKDGRIHRINTNNGDTELFVDLFTIEDLDDITGLTWVSDSGCITKQPTQQPTLAPSEPTLNP
eukprot:684_1